MEDYELDKLATKVLQKHVPNRYPRSNNWKNAMFDFARQYHEIQVKKCDLADVGGSTVNADELIVKLTKASEYWKGYDYHRKYQDGLDKARMMVIEMKNGGVKLM